MLSTLIVLDTHAWVWWTGETGDLSPAAARAISEAEQIGVCTISCWEVAMLVARGRLALTLEVERWVAAALVLPRVVELQLDAGIATRAGMLDREAFPGDPADRIIYATALEQGARLISRDTDITDFDQARVLW
jgi:PIN domain nuclease of toxin-antitoxin system